MNNESIKRDILKFMLIATQVFWEDQDDDSLPELNYSTVMNAFNDKSGNNHSACANASAELKDEGLVIIKYEWDKIYIQLTKEGYRHAAINEELSSMTAKGELIRSELPNGEFAYTPGPKFPG